MSPCWAISCAIIRLDATHTNTGLFEDEFIEERRKGLEDFVNK